MPITLFENPGYTGRSLTIDLGTRRFFTPEDFNDVAASIQVPAGLVVILYEHADDAGGFGVVVDLMEDCPDLGVYGMAKRVSYVNVIASPNVQGFVWARAVEENGQFIAGHWERQRANGQLPPNPGHAAIWPAIPSQLPPAPTALWVNGPTTVITTLGPHDFAGSSYWNHAVNDQMGVLGSDYRNAEEIGTAAFERASNNPVLPDWINFWYPQMPARDHRAPHKRTLVGSLRDVHIAEISGTFQDHDVNIDVTPDPLYQYLLSDAHPREYTDIMKAEYYGTAGQKGQPDCDDAASKAEFTFVEGEVQPSSNVHSGVAEKLRDGIASGDGKVALYGPWIYDKGHCCHSEIHPAEQVWWRTGSTATTYHLNVFCDASKRFWWRDQMDDGTKLKPWGAPPIVGVFAIAFEVDQPSPVARSHALEFTVSQVSATNVASLSPGGAVSELTYQGATLVRFRPNSDAFTVAFEQVGIADNGRIRGFLVLQTTVGTLTQKVVNAQFPAGTDVNAIDQDDERDVFDKQEGHHMFTVTQRYEGDVVIAKKVPKKKKAKKTAGRKKATAKSAKTTTKKVAKKAAPRSG